MSNNADQAVVLSLLRILSESCAWCVVSVLVLLSAHFILFVHAQDDDVLCEVLWRVSVPFWCKDWKNQDRLTSIALGCESGIDWFPKQSSTSD